MGLFLLATGATIMTPGNLYLPKSVSRRDRLAALCASDWLSLAAAPTFAFMAALTGIPGIGAHEMLCSAASHMSALTGMVPMYVLMSVFHFTPWLKLISHWQNGLRAAGLTREGAVIGSAEADSNRRNLWIAPKQETGSTTNYLPE
jgi:hypothetical protein